jgi:hypothetical protein
LRTSSRMTYISSPTPHTFRYFTMRLGFMRQMAKSCFQNWNRRGERIPWCHDSLRKRKRSVMIPGPGPELFAPVLGDASPPGRRFAFAFCFPERVAEAVPLCDHPTDHHEVSPVPVCIGEVPDVQINQTQLPIRRQHRRDGQQADGRAEGLASPTVACLFKVPIRPLRP